MNKSGSKERTIGDSWSVGDDGTRMPKIETVALEWQLQYLQMFPCSADTRQFSSSLFF